MAALGEGNVEDPLQAILLVVNRSRRDGSEPVGTFFEIELACRLSNVERVASSVSHLDRVDSSTVAPKREYVYGQRYGTWHLVTDLEREHSDVSIDAIDL